MKTITTHTVGISSNILRLLFLYTNKNIIVMHNRTITIPATYIAVVFSFDCSALGSLKLKKKSIKYF